MILFLGMGFGLAAFCSIFFWHQNTKELNHLKKEIIKIELEEKLAAQELIQKQIISDSLLVSEALIQRWS